RPAPKKEWAEKGTGVWPGRPLGKDRTRDRDMALEHASEAVPHLGGGLADRDGAGDIRGAVLVLGARVDEKELARRDDAIALGRDAIRDDCPVRSGPRDG